MSYEKVLLKLSGESLMGEGGLSLNKDRINSYAKEIREAHLSGVKIAIVMGGGNLFRGSHARDLGIERVQGDYMGMLATIINGLALQSILEKHGLYTRLMSGLNLGPVCEPFIRRRALRHLQKGRIVIFGSGLGNPYFTTDSTASLRAIEIGADVVLKGTRVGGVYTSDPETDKNATMLPSLSFQEAYEKELQIMDMTAFTLCRENNLPIIVFDMNKAGNLLKVLHGDPIGTRIH